MVDSIGSSGLQREALMAALRSQAAQTGDVQRAARGWLLRLARKRGTLLFPVEAQALVDGRVLMHNEYGARVYSWSPPERRQAIVHHFAARHLQRVWRKHALAAARLRPRRHSLGRAPSTSTTGRWNPPPCPPPPRRRPPSAASRCPLPPPRAPRRRRLALGLPPRLA